ncbi:MAG: di-heme oxidoredictase family protein [Burkholderiales bacterium]
MNPVAGRLLLALLAALPAAALLAQPPALPAAGLTVEDAGPGAYSHPLPALAAQQGELFALGQRMFHNKWAFYWFESAEWGRGPTSNAQSCASCHAGNGRGLTPGDPDSAARSGAGPEPPRDSHIAVRTEVATQIVVRVSLPGEGPAGAPVPLRHYGDQIQDVGVRGVVPAEASVGIEWAQKTIALGDGEGVPLRFPRLRLSNLAFGPLGEEVKFSLRLAPPLIGMGLLEAVPDEAIERLAAREPVDGIRGRVNRVWDASQQKSVLGRFGLKANHGSLREQVASAFVNDIGLSNPVYPEQNCPPIQKACSEQMVAGRPEITALRLAATELYLRALMVPARRNADDIQVRRGERLFEAARCAACHVPELQTGESGYLPQLASQAIRPYTDLLLHDMGEDLADGRPDFLASGREWRTPPLWGIGLSATVNGAGAFLHDGRARNFTEAIFWHGGEAETSREAFRGMAREEREALLAFLASL